MSDRTCSIDGCEKPVHGHGWCGMHYRRWSRWGDPNSVQQHHNQQRLPCSVEDCSRLAVAHTWCATHYERWRHHGDITIVLKGGPPFRGDAISYFGAHMRVRTIRGSASRYICTCGLPAEDWAYDHQDPNAKTDIVGTYSTNPDHYVPLCRKCHRQFDRRKVTPGAHL
jgi:hypothetical protein